MKKKFLIFLVTVMFLAFAGYFCYFIFADNNVQEIEVQGDFRQIYFVGDEFELEGINLKVTYYSGRVEIIPATNNNVNLRYFDLQKVGEKWGSLFYKTLESKVQYCVMEYGAYINQSEDIIFEFNKNGTYNYYKKIDNIWTIRESEFDSSLKFKIEGNKIVLPSSFELNSRQSDYNIISDELYFKFISSETTFGIGLNDSNLVFNRTKLPDSFGLPTSASFDKFNQPFVEVPYENQIAVFEKNSLIGESGLVVNVHYSKGEDFYVFIGDKMFEDGKLDLSEEILNTTRATGAYKNLCEIVLFYRVEHKTIN